MNQEKREEMSKEHREEYRLIPLHRGDQQLGEYSEPVAEAPKTPQMEVRNTDKSARLTAKEALRAYAAMVNTLDVSKLEPLLSDDFHYASQWVFSEIESKQEYLDYMTGKFQTIKATGSEVWAELGEIEESPCVLSQGQGDPIVLIAQGDKNKVCAVILAEIKDNKISRLDMCMPGLYRGKRLGEYPR